MERSPSMDVRQIARLARLELGTDELERLEGEMERILDYVRQLETLDLEGVEPTSHPLPLSTPWREDVPGEVLRRETFLGGAPDHDGQGVVVPRVV